MDLGQRKQALRQLTDASQLEADKALLQSLKPHSRVLKSKFPTPERTQREVLWDLLEVASIDDIKANRVPVKKLDPSNDEEAAKKAADEAAKKAIEQADAKRRLLSMDLESKVDYNDLKHLVAVLDVETTDKKAVTLLAATVEYKAALQDQIDTIKEALKHDMDDEKRQEYINTLKSLLGDAYQEETQLPPADDSEKVDEGSGEEMEEIKAENEDLKGELDEKENELEDKNAELEDTKDELEQTQELLDEKTAELDAEKKSEAKN